MPSAALFNPDISSGSSGSSIVHTARNDLIGSTTAVLSGSNLSPNVPLALIDTIELPEGI